MSQLHPNVRTEMSKVINNAITAIPSTVLFNDCKHLCILQQNI